ncbi:hypothetical protein Q7P37_002237 [Cladosporium fusiforme]
MAPKRAQEPDVSAQSDSKPMEIRPKNSPSSNNNDDQMDLDASQAQPSPESSEAQSSSSDSDSESSSTSSQKQSQIPTLTTGQKPDFSARIAAGAPSLEDRLKAFLPQLAQANDLLAKEGRKEQHSMEDVKDDEPHIEMSLGLGLLEEKKEGEEEEDDDDEEEDGEGEDAEEKRKEKDVMGKLMGGRENLTKGIEEDVPSLRNRILERVLVLQVDLGADGVNTSTSVNTPNGELSGSSLAQLCPPRTSSAVKIYGTREPAQGKTRRVTFKAMRQDCSHRVGEGPSNFPGFPRAVVENKTRRSLWACAVNEWKAM